MQPIGQRGHQLVACPAAGCICGGGQGEAAEEGQVLVDAWLESKPEKQCSFVDVQVSRRAEKSC